MAEKRSVEELFDSLDKIVEELESDDVSLEKAFTLYESGVKIAGELSKEIDLTEKKVLKLTKEGDVDEFS